MCGAVTVRGHYFENGNIQLQTSKQVEAKTVAFTVSAAEGRWYMCLVLHDTFHTMMLQPPNSRLHHACLYVERTEPSEAWCCLFFCCVRSVSLLLLILLGVERKICFPTFVQKHFISLHGLFSAATGVFSSCKRFAFLHLGTITCVTGFSAMALPTYLLSPRYKTTTAYWPVNRREMLDALRRCHNAGCDRTTLGSSSSRSDSCFTLYLRFLPSWRSSPFFFTALASRIIFLVLCRHRCWRIVMYFMLCSSPALGCPSCFCVIVSATDTATALV